MVLAERPVRGMFRPWSLHGASTDRDADQHRRARDIEVPRAMVHQLEMPLPLAGFEIDRNERFTGQTIAWPMTSIDVSGGQLDREVRQPQFLVHADLSPDAAVAVTSAELFSHVSYPNSPGRGIVWKIHMRWPVFTSNPRT